MIYIPPELPEGSKPLESSIGVKFSNDAFLMKSYLDQRKIPYEEGELEDTPMGRCLRIKRNEK